MEKRIEELERKVVELEKQFANFQKSVSCDVNALRADSIAIKHAIISKS
ncbi:hypothetical protein Xmau_00406 [Xenorhabdus mauleonii]|uniref:Uncharacterized protein n=1 Tax=Xenorhabdus mauleonii TaxID=351675 RepID=A0A1I3IW51_9GAMM|nr:hypothetical protein Xmau_00406 [Xenorhabdus mauleonii]SFI52127.1 hypothetical protein SAMN05421680_1022 [Xenorhabdus mauleonii]